MRRYPLLLVNVAGALLALALSACSTQVCNLSNCVGGCCTAMGECVSTDDQHCGKPGTACAQCAAGQQCTSGLCTTIGGCTPACGADQVCDNGTCRKDCSLPSPTPRCSATAVQCQDESIMQLRLFSMSNPDAVTEEGAAPSFRTTIDARGGGVSPTTSYLYMNFTPQGLFKRELSDEQAFTSLDWDIALRRYVLRINSGVSGPGCTEAARTAPGTDFDTLTTVPAGLSWRTEEYLMNPPSCTFVNDTSGLPNAPATALSSFWTYQSCVQMTGNVYVVHLRDGRYVKLQVQSYYSASAQATCNQTGQVPTPNEAGVVRLRWGFLCAPPP
ncbi:MAG: HmuY family protein [Archangiaceae bacterium]|nr:HmuY family protein [Archangiaceae bacterium]